jgi:hypothetical protein
MDIGESPSTPAAPAANQQSATPSGGSVSPPPSSLPLAAGTIQRTLKPGAAQSGIYYGFVQYVDESGDWIFLRPVDQGHPRAKFYVDRKTLYFVDVDRATLEEVTFGKKVAVRFFGNNRALVADAIFVITEELRPKFYRTAKPKRKRVASSSGGAAAPAQH